MKTREQTPIPEYGYMKKIAQAVGCSQLTVRKALRQGAKGEKAERCRQLYDKWYGGGEKVKLL